MNIPPWAVTVGLVVIIIFAAAWLFSQRTDKSKGADAEDSDQGEAVSVDAKMINVPLESVDYLLDIIENRIHEIGGTYQANGRSYHDDLEMTALRAISRQLGFDFEVSSISSGFAVTRHAHQPV
ncbi:hypothetical protein YA0850_32730 [Pseudomonas veronii]|uniref:Cell division protein ZipA n=1 Tax=Pseudomonas veronii TaxID=76761 RepID=A0ABS0VK79_PSEVE|nr:hypothetical protein [Pseudomonas veronii]MBI6557109.1 hypothetical protein [Pseudomonas veronii]MBI6651945.1 hypothetical protein [Pseudomonas veronii]